MVDIKDLLINYILVPYIVKNSTIFSHVCYRGFYLQQLTCPQPLSRPQPALITHPSDVQIANKERKKSLYMAQPQALPARLWLTAPIRSSVAFMFHISAVFVLRRPHLST